ncbi:hypothetical protein BT93_L1298 [Corymbia citriodora subsp. variegata]|uniref:Uncharacterized protein n=1 Tax=Corymbia citriodora subsp. variegata TaxID=360336 RepID=A0A8T0CSI0_CORYI|nr:hypothetical protein BT93_L1298 [Corymbia citriodora subsp. variegata]
MMKSTSIMLLVLLLIARGSQVSVEAQFVCARDTDCGPPGCCTCYYFYCACRCPQGQSFVGDLEEKVNGARKSLKKNGNP